MQAVGEIFGFFLSELSSELLFSPSSPLGCSGQMERKNNTRPDASQRNGVGGARDERSISMKAIPSLHAMIGSAEDVRRERGKAHPGAWRLQQPEDLADSFLREPTHKTHARRGALKCTRFLLSSSWLGL